MPTSVQGLPLHTRSLCVAVSRNETRGFRARGDVIDLCKNGFVPSTYDLQPAGVIHSMNIELELDPERLEIEEIRVDQPFVAVEPSPETGGECCRDPVPRLLELRGEKLDDSFNCRLSAVFGGALGCSHLLTLFQLMASTIPRALALERTRAERESSEPRPGECFFRRSLFLDGHARRDEELIDVSIQLADTHGRPLAPGAPVLERLALSHEIKLLAEIDRKRFRIQGLRTRERRRTHETIGQAEWLDHDEWVAALVGAPVVPGLAKRIFDLVGGGEATRPLRDVLLQLAPGAIQIIAALTDTYYEERARKSAAQSGDGPAVANLGGRQNACYIWRQDGAILRSWAARASDRART